MATKKKAKRKISPRVAPVAKKRGAPRPKKKTGKPAARKAAKKGQARTRGTPTRKATRGKASARRPNASGRGGRSPLPAKKAARAIASAPAARGVTKKKATVQTGLRRRDRPGHLDPKYGAELLDKSGGREDQGLAFVERARIARDDLAEELGEEAVMKATTGGEDVGEESLEQIVPEEQGGPFVETSGAREFGHGTDASNPKDAKREPFPTT